MDPKAAAEYLPLGHSKAAETFVRQPDGYTCGPACLASVARLYGISDTGFDALRQALSPNPQTGSDNMDMAAVAASCLPFVSAGEDNYTGGVAVANIMQGEGHYVVFLCREDDRILYYDPEFHEFAIKKIDDIDWVSESGHLKKWAINFAPLPDNSFDHWRQLAATPPASARPVPPRPPQPGT